MEYRLEASLRQISGKATWNGNLECFNVVLDLLDEQHAEILRQSFLWPLYESRDLQFSGQIIDALLCRLLGPVDGNAFQFDLGGKVVKFSISEFALITGLEITGDDAARASTQRGSRLHDTYFEGRGTVLLPQLRDAIGGCDHMLDRLKLGLVYILESTLRCHHRRTAVDLFHLQIIDDLDAFSRYPWGRRCYEDTVHVFKRPYTKNTGNTRKYDVYGLPLAVQIWLYETVPLIGSRFARRGETRCPRMHHWRASRVEGCPTREQLSALLNDPQLEVIHELTPSMEEEKALGYVRELAPPHNEDDHVSDSTPNRDEECEPVDRRSSPGMTSSSLWPSPPRASPSSWPSPPPPSRGSPAHGDLYVLLSRFMKEMRGEVGELRRDMTGEVGALREEVGEMRREMSGEISSLRQDIAVLRSHISDIDMAIVGIRDDIVGQRRGDRWDDEDGGRGGNGEGGGERDRGH